MFSDLRYDASEEITSNMASCHFLSSLEIVFSNPLSITSGSSAHSDLLPVFEMTMSMAEHREVFGALRVECLTLGLSRFSTLSYTFSCSYSWSCSLIVSLSSLTDGGLSLS